jgi:hypothetical protein
MGYAGAQFQMLVQKWMTRIRSSKTTALGQRHSRVSTWQRHSSSELHLSWPSTHNSWCGLAQNVEWNTGKLTRRSSAALVAPRRLAAAVGFVLLLGPVYGFSNGSLVTKRSLVGRWLLLELVSCFNSWEDRWKLEFERGLGFQVWMSKILAGGDSFYRGF